MRSPLLSSRQSAGAPPASTPSHARSPSREPAGAAGRSRSDTPFASSARLFELTAGPPASGPVGRLSKSRRARPTSSPSGMPQRHPGAPRHTPRSLAMGCSRGHIRRERPVCLSLPACLSALAWS
eukprot:scaffold50438_cov57-Phaeocystis_antarctica.AAC.3